MSKIEWNDIEHATCWRFAVIFGDESNKSSGSQTKIMIWYDSISNSTADSSDIWMQNVSMISHHGRSEICLQARAHKALWAGQEYTKTRFDEKHL